MKAFRSLTQEHRIFERLIQKMEDALKQEEGRAREDIRAVLLVLSPALNRHEDVETAALARPKARAVKVPAKVFRKVERQHREVEALRGQVTTAVVDMDRYSFDFVRARVMELSRRLREHFATEERQLWPYYMPSQKRLVRDKVREVKHNIQEGERAVSEMIGAGQ